MKLLVTFIFLSVIISVSTVNARTIDTINSTGTLKVCALSERMPFSSKSGERSGIQIELATELAKELNVELEVIWLRYRFHARKAGCDLMMEAVARKDDDENKRDIEGARPLTRASDSKKSKLPPQASIPIIKYETYLVGRQETINGNNTLSGIKELNMGVMRGTWSHMLMQKYKIRHRTKFETEETLIQGVADGEVDAGFISSPQYWWFLKNNPETKLSYLNDFDFTREVSLNVGILMRGADENTVKIFNNLLQKMLDNKKFKIFMLLTVSIMYRLINITFIVISINFLNAYNSISKDLISNLHGGKVVHWTSEDSINKAENLIDDDESSYWSTSDISFPQVLTYAFPENKRFEAIIIKSANNDEKSSWAREVRISTADPFPHMGGWVEIERVLLPQNGQKKLFLLRVKGVDIFDLKYFQIMVLKTVFR